MFRLWLLSLFHTRLPKRWNFCNVPQSGWRFLVTKDPVRNICRKFFKFWMGSKMKFFINFTYPNILVKNKDEANTVEVIIGNVNRLLAWLPTAFKREKSDFPEFLSWYFRDSELLRMIAGLFPSLFSGMIVLTLSEDFTNKIKKSETE